MRQSIGLARIEKRCFAQRRKARRGRMGTGMAVFRVPHMIAFGLAALALLGRAQDGAVDPPPAPARLPTHTHGDRGRAYTVYVEQMPGETWDDKIRSAVNRAVFNGMGAEVVLPPGHLRISKPIRLWKQRKAGEVDTRADGIELADVRQVWGAIKGGRVQDLPRGMVFRGSTAGTTLLIWDGGPNQVVIDMPAPWDCTVSNLRIDGNNAEGTVGIRYRPGWEFGVNGGKKDLFERIALERIDVGIHVGGPFGPDLVGSTFRHISVHACRIGLLLESANVAEMWFKECFVGDCEEAGFKLIGHRGRVLRRLAEEGTPTDEEVVVDAWGREIFLEQLPPVLVKQKVNNAEHADVPGSGRRPWAGGGSPTCSISDLVAHMHSPMAWMVDSNWAPVRLEHVRMEGCSGAVRVQGKGMRNTRFNDMLIDVNVVTTGGINGYAIEYHKGGPITFLGGTFEGPIGLGQNTVCYSMGTRFLNRQRPMGGWVRQGRQLPEGGFYELTGKTMTVPYRRWKGERVVSGVHDTIGFEQMPGTSNARLHRLNESHSLTAQVQAGRTTVTVPLGGLRRQPDAGYQVHVTPRWRAGSVWVSKREPGQFTVDVDNPAPAGGGALDVLIHRPGFEGVLRAGK